MAVQSQTDQWKGVEDMRKVEEHTATHRDRLPAYGWTDDWFTRIFLLSLPVQESRQEAQALRNFTRWERRHGGQPRHV